MIDHYVVYLHRRLDTGQVFYVGKGKPTRATMKAQRSLYWNRIVDKCNGYVVEYIGHGLIEKEALELEKKSIAAFREIGVALCNLTDGGDGVSGHKHSLETRKKMSESHKGKPPPNKGMKMSDEVRKKLSIIHLNRYRKAA